MKLSFNQSTGELLNHIKQLFSKLNSPQNLINRNRNGFSLMSLVIVIAVIAVLVIMAVPAFIGHIENARLSQIIHDGRLIQDAADRYYMSNQTVFWDPDGEGVNADSFIAEVDADGVVLSGSMEYLPEAFITEDGTEVSFQDIIDGLEGDETARFFDVNLSSLSDYVNIRSNAGYFIMRNPTGQVLISDPRDEVTQARLEHFSSGESSLATIEYSVVPDSLEITVFEGGTTDIEVTLTDPAEGYTIEFESVDDSIATVNSSGSVGTVTGVGEGETEIEVKITADGYSDVIETISVTTSALLDIEYSISPADSQLVVVESDTDNIVVNTTNPEDGYFVEFESADTSIATVDSAGSVGTVTGIEIGETEIEIKITADGYNDMTETIAVNVIPIPDDLILYDNGDQHSSVTGGWESSTSGQAGSITTVDFETDRISLYASKPPNSSVAPTNAIITTNNAVSRTGYRYLNVEWAITSSSGQVRSYRLRPGGSVITDPDTHSKRVDVTAFGSDTNKPLIALFVGIPNTPLGGTIEAKVYKVWFSYNEPSA